MRSASELIRKFCGKGTLTLLREQLASSIARLLQQLLLPGHQTSSNHLELRWADFGRSAELRVRGECG